MKRTIIFSFIVLGIVSLPRTSFALQSQSSKSPDQNQAKTGIVLTQPLTPVETKNPAYSVQNQDHYRGEDPTTYIYPRLALGSSWIQDWLNKPGYGLNFLYQFGQIYTYTLSEEVLTVKQRAIADGHQDWAEKVQIIFVDCFETVKLYTDPPLDYEIMMARNNPGIAKRLAVYYNFQAGCDWYLRDIHGEPIIIWGEQHYAINGTPDCPLGRWDGMAQLQSGEWVDTGVGSTVGLTYLQWLAGPLTQNVIRNSQFAAAYNGVQTEGMFLAWEYYINHQIPDPKRDGVGFPNQQEFADYCHDTFDYFVTDFISPLKDQFITRLNGNGLRWYFEHWQNPWPSWQEAFTGCKMERFGGWGGWPNWVMILWIQVYKGIEDMYHPFSDDPNDPEFDSQQGWDVTTVQSNPRYSWTHEHIHRWTRVNLAACLLGDGYFDGQAYEGDYYFGDFLRGGHPEYAPHFIVQQKIKLGRALGDYMTYPPMDIHLVYYRQFYNDENQRMYTVVCNPWDQEYYGIPARDGVWFVGDWPYGEYVQIPANDTYPHFKPIGNKQIDEKKKLEFDVVATDSDQGDILTLSAQGTVFTKGAAFEDHGNGTGTFTWTPSYTDSGNYLVSFKATDLAGLSDIRTIMISVANVKLNPTTNNHQGNGKKKL